MPRNDSLFYFFNEKMRLEHRLRAPIIRMANTGQPFGTPCSNVKEPSGAPRLEANFCEEFVESGVAAIGTRDVQTNRFEFKSGWCVRPDHVSIIEGSSAANTNNALRTLRRMLKKAHEWQLLSVVPIVNLVEEHVREELIEPLMGQQLLIVTTGPRLTPKSNKARVGWEPFRMILLIMRNPRRRPGASIPMRWEKLHWDKGLIFNPRGKAPKSRRYVPLT